jgi:myo-inositol 2-dehydrogenase/D-chiro-inositol 1-dehydrogenase
MIRCGLIGYGAWGRHHARVIHAHPQAQLVAIVAQSEATRRQALQDHPDSNVHAQFADMLAREQLDAVVVVLPSHLHFSASSAVLESGRHLLLEKPMCLSSADCDTLNTLAQAHQRVLAIGHEMRLSSLWGKVKELIDAGALGQPRYALIELWRRPYRTGADGWRYDINRVGSWILEEPIHFFDLARWYFERFAEPLSVEARASSRRPDHPELHDHFTAIVNFKGGAYSVVSQCLGGWEHHQVVKLSGTDGALWASWSGALDRTFTPTFSLRVQRGANLEEVPIPRPAGEVFELEEQFDRFLRAIQTGIPPAATGEDGAWSVRLCLKAEESVRKGAVVAL